MAKIMAFSGSPIRNGSIEKGLEAVLEATGLEYELVRLSEIDMRVCMGCKGCVGSNRCVIDDGVNPLLEKIEKAQGLVLSAFPSFGSVNALTKVFIERNWPLRHRDMLTQGKAGAAVVCGGSGPKELAGYLEGYFTRYLRMSFLGALVLEGNVPCLSCGFGETCPGSGVLAKYGPGARIAPGMFNDFSQDRAARGRATELGQALARAIEGSRAGVA
ncbi:MAG: flavodoxin family protein [Deltaproteobacteria bacterium]|jgi:multimeric flavodoxin WrbA|nr:flavodoxin family protein [Deltaproteobacteria bacterium]